MPDDYWAIANRALCRRRPFPVWVMFATWEWQPDDRMVEQHEIGARHEIVINLTPGPDARTP